HVEGTLRRLRPSRPGQGMVVGGSHGSGRVMIELSQIPDDVLRVQREASDPSVSAWVAANAGSGKTHVLAQRVIRLLLRGVDPAKILCLTFTKAAAANMANQVFATLVQWVALDDSRLDAAIADIEGRPDARSRARARRLFA